MVDSYKDSTKPTPVVDSVKVSFANGKMLTYRLNQAHRQYVDSDIGLGQPKTTPLQGHDNTMP